jgi:polar amino acid transport system substrate-binding protein
VHVFPVKVAAAIFAGTSILAVFYALPSAVRYARADDPAVAAKNHFEGDAGRADAGRGLFNQYCAHCHGSNAVSPDPPRDLRRLKRRYGENMANVFYFTVTHGRPDKGMPDWTGRLDDETLSTIFTFLQTVQAEP